MNKNRVEILQFLSNHQGKWCTWLSSNERTMPSIANALPHLTESRILYLCKKLKNKGYIGGCPCGCRGDFEITDKGLEFLGIAIGINITRVLWFAGTIFVVFLVFFAINPEAFEKLLPLVSGVLSSAMTFLVSLYGNQKKA
jgi:hypothetical protein